MTLASSSPYSATTIHNTCFWYHDSSYGFAPRRPVVARCTRSGVKKDYRHLELIDGKGRKCHCPSTGSGSSSKSRFNRVVRVVVVDHDRQHRPAGRRLRRWLPTRREGSATAHQATKLPPAAVPISTTVCGRLLLTSASNGANSRRFWIAPCAFAARATAMEPEPEPPQGWVASHEVSREDGVAS